MRFLPLALDVRGRRCVVVGGGIVATRKVRTLLEAGADVRVVSPDLTRELAAAADDGGVTWVKASFASRHLDGAHLVVMATDDADVNATGALLARTVGVPVCNASAAADSTVIFGALLQADGMIVATFTDGEDPGRARRQRDRIRRLLLEEEAP